MSECDISIEKQKKKPHKRGAITAREAALEVLHSLFQQTDGTMPLPVMLSRAVQEAGLHERDAALLSELAYGVLRRHAVLDASLRPYIRKPGALSLQVRLLLRIGAFEILYLDTIPARATVNEMAGLARRRFGQKVGGFVNAVLRALAQESADLAETPRACTSQASRDAGDPLSSLAEESSLPFWLLSLWQEQYGYETARRFALRTGSAPAPSWRVNPIKPWAEMLLQHWLDKGYMPVGSVGFSAQGLDKRRPDAQKERSMLESFEKQGCLTRQGMASQMVGEDIASWIQSRASLQDAPLWDACCGRGGKTSSLLEKGINVALSSDPSAFRLEEMKSNLLRLGLRAPQIRCAPAQDVEVEFPLILLDAPCSGTGTLGRNAELRLRLSPEKLAESARLQEELLRSVWGKLQPGGALFYVTCALNREENEGQTERFLLSCNGEASLVEERMYVPEAPGQDALYMAIFQKQGRLPRKDV